MKIPQSAQSAMGKAFYDKTVQYYTVTLTDVPGKVGKQKQQSAAQTIRCNIQPIGKETLQRRYGLDIDAELRLSCSPAYDLANGGFIEWDGAAWEIVRTIKREGYLEAFCKRR